jgi:phospholipid/cholesterol/gamma-HCH transport system substrate-binding protein
MLLERNQAVIGFVIAILVAIGTVFAVGATGGLLVPGDRFQADFADAAGLESGSFVYIAGIRVGQVTDVELLEDRVRVTFSSEAPPFPADSSADIILANTLGKRGVRINVGSQDAMLPINGMIPLERNGTPIDIPELGDRTAELLTELDVATLQELTTALADVADGSKDDLVRLLVGLEDVSQIIVNRRGDLQTLLTEGTILIDAVGDADQDIIRIIDAFGSTLDRLDGRRGDIKRLLTETVSVTDTANALLVDRGDQIDGILTDLHTDLEIIDAHQVDLAHTFAYIGVGLDGFSSIGYSGLTAKADNPSWGNVFATEVGPLGVETLLGCGGSLDVVFTETVGPDPRCEEPDDASASTAGGVINVALDPVTYRRASIGTFFNLGGQR